MAADETQYELLTRIAAALSGTLTTTPPPANQSINLAQVNGLPVATGAGTAGSTSIQRVNLAIGSAATLAEFAATTLGASQTLIAAGTTRQAVLIANDSDQILYVRYGATPATSASYSLKIPVGGIYEVPRSFAGIEIRAIGAAVGVAGAVHVTSVI